MPKPNITFDLAGINEALKTFILEHQGEKGFINTKCIPTTLTRCRSIVYELENYDDWSYSDDELYIKASIAAVRVKDGKIEIVYNDWNDHEDEEIAEMEDDVWTDINDDDIVTSYTLHSIIENIEKFVED